jgi:hypothetical protein
MQPFKRPSPVRHIRETIPSIERDNTSCSFAFRPINTFDPLHLESQVVQTLGLIMDPVNASATPRTLYSPPRGDDITPVLHPRHRHSRPRRKDTEHISNHNFSCKVESAAGHQRQRKGNAPRASEPPQIIDYKHTDLCFNSVHQSNHTLSSSAYPTLSRAKIVDIQDPLDQSPVTLERPVMSTEHTSPYSDQPSLFLNIGETACLQCGRLLLQHPACEGKMVLDPSIGSAGSAGGLLGSNSYDPFDSAAISISYRMHELLHNCELSIHTIESFVH